MSGAVAWKNRTEPMLHGRRQIGPSGLITKGTREVPRRWRSAASFTCAVLVTSLIMTYEFIPAHTYRDVGTARRGANSA